MSISRIAHSRFVTQRLVDSDFSKPEEVVRWFGSVQAQDYAGAKWALGLRIPGTTDRSIEDALTEKKVLRTWTIRGTLHFVLPEDVAWLLDLVAHRTIAGCAKRYRDLGLDEKTLHQSNDILGKALQSGRQLKRSELLALLNQNGISTQGQRAPHLLGRAALDQVVIQSASVRNDPIYHLFEDAVPHPRRLDPQSASLELARRYYQSHGPASLQDFVWWSGLRVSEAKAALEEMKPDLIVYSDGKATVYCTEPCNSGESLAQPITALLPPFDEMTVGYKDRSASVDPDQAMKIRLANGLSPTIAVDGKIVGIWGRKMSPKKVVVSTHIEVELDGIRMDQKSAVERYSQFLEKTVVFE